MNLYDKLSGQGLEIVAFPCNQFGGQEPGSSKDIQLFLKEKGVKFPVMEKTDVNGPGTHPVYSFLKGPDTGDIRWNFFTKFLVQCNLGEQCDVYRYNGAPNPATLEEDIIRLIGSGKHPTSEL